MSEAESTPPPTIRLSTMLIAALALVTLAIGTAIAVSLAMPPACADYSGPVWHPHTFTAAPYQDWYGGPVHGMPLWVDERTNAPVYGSLPVSLITMYMIPYLEKGTWFDVLDAEIRFMQNATVRPHSQDIYNVSDYVLAEQPVNASYPVALVYPERIAGDPTQPVRITSHLDVALTIDVAINENRTWFIADLPPGGEIAWQPPADLDVTWTARNHTDIHGHVIAAP